MTVEIDPITILSWIGGLLTLAISALSGIGAMVAKRLKSVNLTLIKLDKNYALMQKDITAALEAAKKSEETWTKLTLVRAATKRAHQRIDKMERKQA